MVPAQISITASQAQTLTNLRDSGQYSQAYDYLGSIARDAQVGAPESSRQEYRNLEDWLDRASSINANDGSWTSEFVRGATQAIGESTGHPISASDFQDASDGLARGIIDRVLSDNKIPYVREIVQKDAETAVERLNLPPWGWAGTWGDILPPPLGLGEDYVSLPTDSWREWARAWGKSLAANWTGVGRALDRTINDWWNNAKTPPRRDPLAIDLDGDGIETIGLPTAANPFNPVLFDHNADGIKTGTGWVRPDDAWLVLDRNGNGVIDSGRELFGVDTIITAPTVVTNNGLTYSTNVTRSATNGFEALRSLDSNADNVFNASDAQFANVRLWQDANQDGISQASELKTLTEQGITAISLTPDSSNINLGNGNTVTGQAAVTRTNGTSTTVAGVGIGLDASNLNLADNPFYRHFNDAIPLTDAAKALPGMGRHMRNGVNLYAANSASYRLASAWC